MHTDEQAAESARAVNALAFTVGKDVIFGAGQYSLGTREGWRLIAHELTHVVQQGFSQAASKTLQLQERRPHRRRLRRGIRRYGIIRDRNFVENDSGVTLIIHFLYSPEKISH